MFAAVSGLIVDVLRRGRAVLVSTYDVAVVGSGPRPRRRVPGRGRRPLGGRAGEGRAARRHLRGLRRVRVDAGERPDGRTVPRTPSTARSPTWRQPRAGAFPRNACAGTSRRAGRPSAGSTSDTLVALAALPRPDYHPEWPGSARGRGLGQPAVRRREVPGALGPAAPADLLPDDHDGRARRLSRHGHRRRARRPPRRRGHPDDGRRAGRRARGVGGGAGRRDRRRLRASSDLAYADGWWTLAGVRARCRRPRLGRARVEPAAAGGVPAQPGNPDQRAEQHRRRLELGLAAGAAVATMVGVWRVPGAGRSRAHLRRTSRPAGWRTSS